MSVSISAAKWNEHGRGGPMKAKGQYDHVLLYNVTSNNTAASSRTLALLMLSAICFCFGCTTAKKDYGASPGQTLLVDSRSPHPLFIEGEEPLSSMLKYRGFLALHDKNDDGYRTGDLNKDNVVDDRDVEFLHAAWWVQSGGDADLDDDAIIGQGDLDTLMHRWGTCESPCEPDLTDDGMVDDNDLMLLSWAYAVQEGVNADMNEDGTIDGRDLVILLNSLDELRDEELAESDQARSSSRPTTDFVPTKYLKERALGNQKPLMPVVPSTDPVPVAQERALGVGQSLESIVRLPPEPRTVVPSAASKRERLPPNRETSLPETRHWDFEDGTLQGWDASHINAHGTAFKHQPTYGNNVSTKRARRNDAAFMELINKIGGDYWDGPYPIGVQGEYWIGTYEKRPNRSWAWGGYIGDGPVGTLVSPEFTLGKRYIHFLIGGGCDERLVRIELSVKGVGGWQAVLDSRRTGKCDEHMERVVIDLDSLDLEIQDSDGRYFKGRLYIHDLSNSSWGHINIDDIWVTDTYPWEEDAPVWGFADTHTHLAAQLAFDGLLFSGRTSDLAADGTENNLSDCGGHAHARNKGVSTSKLIYQMEDQHLFGRKAPEEPWSTAHEPTSATSSKWYSLTHQQMYEKWIHRAYCGGLRLLVAEAVNSRVLAWGLSGNHPDVGPLADSHSYVLQIQEITNIVNRNADWMEIALTPSHARRIIRDNKLAVILGIEVDSFADCDLSMLPTNDGKYYHAGSAPCDIDRVIEELSDVFSMGVRQLHPIHLTDNGFGGAAVYSDEFNTSNHYLNNEFFSVRHVPSTEIAWYFDRKQSVVGSLTWGGALDELSQKKIPGIGGFVGAIAGTVGEVVTLGAQFSKLPVRLSGVIYNYSKDYGHVNQRGLSEHGRALIRAMINRGMIIAVDHMSEVALDELLSLENPTFNLTRESILANPDCMDLADPECQDSAYPIALTHSGARELQFDREEADVSTPYLSLRRKEILKSEGGKRYNQIRRIALIGGITAPGVAGGDIKTSGDVANDCAGSSCSFAQSYQYFLARQAKRIHGLHVGLPIGTDFNGLNGSVNPRYGRHGCWKRNRHFAPSEEVKVSMAMTHPRFLEDGASDYAQRLKQLEKKGVNYDFYNATPGTYVWHDTSLEYDWKKKVRKKMIVEAKQPSLVAAKKREGSEGWEDHWDINFDGVAHYGMLPDFLQDLRVIGLSREDLGPFFLGAEAYIRMWEKACRLSELSCK